MLPAKGPDGDVWALSVRDRSFRDTNRSSPATAAAAAAWPTMATAL